MAAVDVVDDVVAGGERDDRVLAVGRIRRRPRAGVVEDLRDVGGDPAIAHGVEHRLERGIGLPVDVDELTDVQVCAVRADVDDAVAGGLAYPHLCVEEPERAVVVADVAQLVASRRHGGELVRVAEHHDLHAAERLGPSPTGLTQRSVDGIHEVGVHHRYLVDDEGVDRVEDLAGGVGLIDLALRDEADRQPEQRMDRLTLDVQRRNAGRGAYGDLLARVPGQVLQERRLARSRTAGDEHVLPRVLDEPEQRLLFGGERRRGHRFMLASGCRAPAARAAIGGG